MNATEAKALFRQLQGDHLGSHEDCDACRAMGILNTVLARHWDPRSGGSFYLSDDEGGVSRFPREVDGPVIYPRIDSDKVEARMIGRLRQIARRGCSRLVGPGSCRSKNGYPEDEWCVECIAAAGLGLPEDWFVLKP